MIPRKNILFIARWYPDRYDSMLGLFVQKQAQAVQQFHDVSVLYIMADSNIPKGTAEKLENDFHGIKEFRIYFGKHNFEFNNAVAYAKYYLEGLKWIEKHSGQPDLVHVHILTRAAFPAIWLQLTKSIPYIVTEHWSRYLPVNVARNAYSGFFRKLFTRFAVSRAKAVTTVTANLAEAMKLAGLKNDYYITPNVVNIHDFIPDSAKSTPLIKKLVHVSCFDEPAKNIKGIINAVQKIALTRNDFLLEIIGDGKDFENVKNHAEKTGLINSRIYFTGLLTGKKLEDKMRTATALVMFSNYENLPCTIIESLSCGVPVISTDVGGIREHLFNDFGILIEQGNEIALITAIDEMLDNPGKFNSQKMRKYSEAHFSMEAIGNLFNSIYVKSGIR